jgi:hypothetical protein
MCEGTRVVVMRKFKPDLFIQSIKEHKVCLKYLHFSFNFVESETTIAIL